MGRPHNKLQMRNLIGILKDKASLIRAALLIKRKKSSLQAAVIRATTHSSASPPPDHRVAALLEFGQSSRPTAASCIAAIMDRLHNTGDAYVALKCLLTLHHVIDRGSFILKDQVSFFPTTGGRNFLNLSRFRDARDPETWELSSWVRYYAGVLERNLMASRVLGITNISSNSNLTKIDDKSTIVTSSSNADLMREIEVLVGFVEEICAAPESLHRQENELVHQPMKMIAEDYRSAQLLIMVRLSEFGMRIAELNSSESVELTRYLNKLEECRERLVVLFVNRKKNEAFWDLVSQTKTELAKANEDREKGMWLVRTGVTESTRFGEGFSRPREVLRLPYGGGQWVGADRVQLTVQPVA